MNKRDLQRLAALAAIFAGASCININIYFPEAEVRQAAEEIVHEVRPEGVETDGQSPQGSKEPSATEPKASGDIWSLFRTRMACAQEEEKKEEKKIELDVKSPVIKKIKEALKARYAKLLPFYEKGAVGEGADGYLAARDTEGLSLKEKRDVQALVKEENEDRKNLYSEIVKSNGIEESYLARVGALFSKEWQKASKPGWWIEAGPGSWEKKKKEEKKKK